MLRIPYSLTKDRQLYLYWQKKYNPKQFDPPSTFQMGLKPGNKVGYYIMRFYNYLVNKMGRKTKWDMNPEEFWLINNPNIVKEQEENFRSDMSVVKNMISDDIYKFIVDNRAAGVFTRSNVLTVTWALRKIIKE